MLIKWAILRKHKNMHIIKLGEKLVCLKTINAIKK